MLNPRWIMDENDPLSFVSWQFAIVELNKLNILKSSPELSLL